MNGTTGMMLKIAHATFGPVARSLRVARSIQMSTTASGCMKQTRISISFFTIRNYPGGRGSDRDPGAVLHRDRGGRAGAGALRRPQAADRGVARPGAGVPAWRQYPVGALPPAIPAADRQGVGRDAGGRRRVP